MTTDPDDFVRIDVSDTGRLRLGEDGDFPGLELLHRLGFSVVETPDGRNLLSADGMLFHRLHQQEDTRLRQHDILDRVKEGSRWVDDIGQRFVRGRDESRRADKHGGPRPSLAYTVPEAEELLTGFLLEALTGDIDVHPKPGREFPIYLLPEEDRIEIAMQEDLRDTPYPHSLCRLMFAMLGIEARDGHMEVHREVLQRPVEESIALLREGRLLIDGQDIEMIAERDGAFHPKYNNPGTRPESHKLR